jgi:hypothetical protein
MIKDHSKKQQPASSHSARGSVQQHGPQKTIPYFGSREARGKKSEDPRPRQLVHTGVTNAHSRVGEKIG